MYGRQVDSIDNGDLVKIVEVYYLNQNRVVGHLVYVEDSLTVLANDVEWGMRKLRTCDACKSIVRIAEECPLCGGKHFTYKSTDNELLTENLEYVENKFRNGESAEPTDDTSKTKKIIVK